MAYRFLCYYLYFTSAEPVFAHYYLPVYSLLQLVYVGDYSDKAVALGKTFQRIHSLIKRFFVKRAVALVNKHCI